MVNNDLGTAHGRIRIDIDDRATADAAKTLILLQAQFDKMNTHLAKIEKSLNTADQSFEKVDKSAKKAAKSSKTLGAASWAMNKALDAVGRDFSTVANNIQTFSKYAAVASTRLRQLKLATGFFQSIGAYNKEMSYFNSTMRVTSGLMMKLVKDSKETNRWFSAWTRGNTILGRTLTGLSSNVKNNTEAWMKWRSVLLTGSLAGKILKNQLIGVDKLVNQSPNWVKKLGMVNQALLKIGLAGSALSIALLPLTRLQRFANTKIFKALGDGVTAAGVKVGSFGKIFGKAFGPGAYRSILNFSNKIQKAGGNLDQVLDVSSKGVGRFRSGLNSVLRPYRALTASFGKLTLGFAMIGSGFNNLWESMQWIFKLPKPLMAGLAVFFSRILPGAINILGRALEGTSNLVAGLWDGLKVLSRGAVSLPGLFAGIGAAVSSLLPVFAGLKNQLSALFDADPAKAMEAYYALPEQLKPLGRAIQDIVPKWKELQQSLQATAFKGVEKQIGNLARIYFPLFEKGATKVVSAFVEMKNAAYEFAMEQKTRTDFASVYSATAVAVQNLAKATKPAAAGFRDMAAQGVKFFRDASIWAPYLSKKFSEWAKLNSQNGTMMRWMQDARDGAYSLAKGLTSAAKSAYGILTIFQTNSGTNFLDRFASSMSKFEGKVLESSISGLGAKFRDFYKTVGSENLKDIKEVFGIFAKLIADSAPLIKNLSDSFSTMFVPAMSSATTIVTKFEEVLSGLGIDKVVGLVLGLVAAWTLMPNVLKNVWQAIKIVWGSLIIFKSGPALIKGMSTALTTLYVHLADGKGKFSQWGAALTEKLQNIVNSSGKAIGIIARLASGFTLLGAAILMGIQAKDSANKKLKEFNEQVELNNKTVREYGQNLRKAFIADAGSTSGNVISNTKESLVELEQQMEKTAKMAPGWLDNVWSWMTTATNRNEGFLGSSKEFNNMQEEANQAKLAAEGFAKLRKEKVDLNSLLVSSDEYYFKEVQNLRDTGDAGNAAADQLDKLRKQYIQNREDARTMGQSGLLLQESLDKVAESGGNAAQALDGLRGTLTALGILQVDAAQAAIDWYDALDELPGKVAEISAETNNFGDAALVVDGKMNAAAPGVRALGKELIALGDAYLRQASATKDIEGSYSEFLAEVDKISAATGRTTTEILELSRILGLEKEWTNVIVQLKDKDKLTRDVFEAFAAAREAAGTGISVPISPEVPRDQLQKEINDAVGREVITLEGNNLLKISPDLKTEEMDSILRLLAEKGVEIPGMAKKEPLKIPVSPYIAGNDPSGKVITGLEEVMKSALGEGTEENKDEPIKSVQDFIDSVIGTADGAKDDAKTSGEAFSENFAQGIRDRIHKIEEAARDAAKAAADPMPGSPAKTGPLSGRGWTRIRGQSFSSDFAAGIYQNRSDVASAASSVAGAAGNNLKNDKAYGAGKYLGQLLNLNDFFARAVEAFGKIAETVFDIAKFASDPLSKGTFFGKSLSFQRDPNISDKDLAQKRADAAQAREFNFRNSARYPNRELDRFGMPRITAPGLLGRDASSSEIQGAIVAEAQKRGLNAQQITAALAIARQESDYDPGAIGYGQGAFQPDGTKGNAYGVFQQTETWGTPEQLLDPNYAINKFFDAFVISLQQHADPLAAAILTQNPQLGANALTDTYGQKTAELLKEAGDDLKTVLSTGATLRTQGSGFIFPGIGALSGMGKPSQLIDSTVESQPSAVQAANAVLLAFGDQIRNPIGGSGPRPNAPGTHDVGLAIDIPIDPDQMGLGDAINAWLQQNAEQLNIRYTIWRDQGIYAGQSEPAFNEPGHFNHIDVQFNDGSTAKMTPNGTDLTVPYGVTGLFPSVDVSNVPPTPEQWAEWDNPTTPESLVNLNPDGTTSPVHAGDAPKPGPNIPIDETTGLPFTREKSNEFWSKPENQLQYDASLRYPGDENIPGLYRGSQDQLINEMQLQTPLLAQIEEGIRNGFQGMDEATAIAQVEALNPIIDSLKEQNTPEGRSRLQYVEGLQNQITSEFGLSQVNPIDQARQVVGQITGIASDVFQLIGSAIEAVGSAKEMADTFVRGIANTEDLYNMVDNVQKFIQLGADIAGAASSITSAAATIAGGATAASGGQDGGAGMAASTALSAMSSLFSITQSIFEATNAVIDLGQEAYRIAGSYFGDFLGYLVGGAGGQLMGNVKFLLDEKTNELLAYSVDNPADKRSHNLAGQEYQPSLRNQAIGTINVYGGPGQDPRDNTRQMMYQIRASEYAGATAQ